MLTEPETNPAPASDPYTTVQEAEPDKGPELVEAMFSDHQESARKAKEESAQQKTERERRVGFENRIKKFSEQGKAKDERIAQLEAKNAELQKKVEAKTATVGDVTEIQMNNRDLERERAEAERISAELAQESEQEIVETLGEERGKRFSEELDYYAPLLDKLDPEGSVWLAGIPNRVKLLSGLFNLFNTNQMTPDAWAKMPLPAKKRVMEIAEAQLQGKGAPRKPDPAPPRNAAFGIAPPKTNGGAPSGDFDAMFKGIMGG
jgi:hypothetical protein